MKPKPSEICKKAGLKSLVELSRISRESEQTLINWHREKPFRFYALLEKAVRTKRNQWTTEKPTAPGWYWASRAGFCNPMWIQEVTTLETLTDGYEWCEVEQPPRQSIETTKAETEVIK